MAQQATSKVRDTAAAVGVKSNREELKERLRNRIASKAYELFERNRGNHGNDMAHWLRAEAETVSTVPEIRESGNWLTINIPMRGFSASELQVSIDPQDIVIVAEKGPLAELGAAGVSNAFEEARYMTAKWPSDVDPATASAYLKDESLTVTVKRMS